MKNSEKNVNVLNLIAFIALIIFAVLQIFSVLSFWGVLTIGGALPKILDTVKNICVCIVIGILGYKFVAGKSKGLVITYWVCIAVIVVGTILIWVK